MKRIGFHYIPDTKHYRQSDLKAWLPELSALGAHWLVMITPANRAIPESFLRGIIQAGVTPILHFPFRLDQLPEPRETRLLFKTYARWGVEYAILFDRPNTRGEWQVNTWTQTDLVERFLDKFLPLAEECLKSGLTPIFPPLEPGGDYWDTTFLRAALQGIHRRGHKQLLDQLVIGAYAWTGDRHLNWGAGGPERWPDARPYLDSPNVEDQRSFRIFDWYITISEAALGRKLPLFLFGLGARLETLKTENTTEAEDPKNYPTPRILTIARLLANEEVDGLDPISSTVIGGAFWTLAASPGSPHAYQAWYKPDGNTLPIVEAMQKWVKDNHGEPQTIPKAVPQEESVEQNGDHSISHYVLLPSYDWGVSDYYLEAIRPFVKKYKPTIGFSLDEAILAKRVTVVGGHQTGSETILKQLIAAGCVVEHINGDGTDIAINLARK
jgi:hypothetical protein